jgi:hypothetical protein
MRKVDKAYAAIGAAAVIAAMAYGVPAIASAATAAPSPAAPGAGRHAGAEKVLTGAPAAKVKAAVLAKLPGASVQRMSAEDADEKTKAAYEAHATKADGSHVEVLLDKNFAVIAMRAEVDRGHGRGGGRGLGPGAGPRDGGRHFDGNRPPGAPRGDRPASDDGSVDGSVGDQPINA